MLFLVAIYDRSNFRWVAELDLEQVALLADGR